MVEECLSIPVDGSVDISPTFLLPLPLADAAKDAYRKRYDSLACNGSARLIYRYTIRLTVWHTHDILPVNRALKNTLSIVQRINNVIVIILV